jgi:hypothetical protein
MCPLVDCVACGIVPGKEEEEEEEEDCVLSRFPRRVERGRQKGEKGDIFILVVRCRRSGKVSRTFLEENEETVSIAVIIDERARVKERVRGLRRRGKPSLLCRRRRRRRKSIFHDESNKRYPLNTLVSSLLLSYNN